MRRKMLMNRRLKIHRIINFLRYILIIFHAVMMEAILLQITKQHFQLNSAPVKGFTTTSLRTPDNKTGINEL